MSEFGPGLCGELLIDTECDPVGDPGLDGALFDHVPLLLISSPSLTTMGSFDFR